MSTAYILCGFFSLLGLLFLIWHEIFFRLLQSFLKQCALSLNQAHHNQIVSMKSQTNIKKQVAKIDYASRIKYKMQYCFCKKKRKATAKLEPPLSFVHHIGFYCHELSLMHNHTRKICDRVRKTLLQNPFFSNQKHQ